MARSTDTRGDRPESYERERGQIQFQNFVATWLSRIKDRPHIFLGLGQYWHIFNCCFRQSCAVWLELENCFKDGARFTNLASIVGKKSMSP